MKKSILISIPILFVLFTACSKQTDQSKDKEQKIQIQQKQTSDSQFNYPQINQNSYSDLDSYVDKKVALKGVLTGEKFEHLVYYHPPFDEIAHFNLSQDSRFYQDMSHIVIYFKRKTNLQPIYKEFLDKPAIIYGTLGKVSGAMLKVSPDLVKKRLEHTIYYLDVEKIEAQ